MNKIIKGKRYDTSTAKKLYSLENNVFKEALYKKRTGEFFMIECDKIIPLTEREAMEWSKEVMDVDEFKKIFEKISEDKKTVTSLSLSYADSEKIKKEAVKRKISVSELVSKLINNADRNGWDL